MARWEPGAAGRLREAAMELYAERGYDSTTVADIADRAGVTARTFFRHFADKREVLFAGSEELLNHMVAALTAAPESATPMEAVTAAVVSSGRYLRRFPPRLLPAAARRHRRDTRAPRARADQDGLADGGLHRSLAQPGSGPPDVAALAAETGIAVFRVAFERWVAGPPDVPLADVIRSTLATLAGLTA